MQANFLRTLIGEISGEDSKPIVEILFDKKDVNEFLIAKKMNLTINQVRNILYRLSAEGLVSFTRKKDKKKGWYIYFWTLNSEKCLIKIEQALLGKIEELKRLLHDRETKRFYMCKGCDIEATEEKALENEFSCSECAEVYTIVDNTNSIRDLKGRITKREREISEIKNELEILRQKNSKKAEKEKKKIPPKKNKKRKSPPKKKKKK
jgi:transcription factor E